MPGLSWNVISAEEAILPRWSAENCLGDDELEDYLFDRLKGETLEWAEEHLLVCEHCQDRVEAEASFRSGFREAATSAEAEDVRRGASGAVDARPGWKDSLALGWSILLGRGGALAMAGLALLTLGIVYSPLIRRTGPETTVALSLARGAEDTAVSAPAGNALRLSADVKQLPPLTIWQVDVVSATGELEHRSEVSAADGRLNWQVKDGLPGGRHWVRLRNPSDGSLVREFGLNVR